MTVKDMYTGFMKPEEIKWWTDRLTNARTGFFTPPGLVDTINLPSVNGGALFFSTGADPTNPLATESVYTGDAFGLVYPALQSFGRFALPSTSPTGFNAPEAHKSLDKVLALDPKHFVPDYG